MPEKQNMRYKIVAHIAQWLRNSCAKGEKTNSEYGAK